MGFACVLDVARPLLPSVVLLIGCFVKGPFNTQRSVKMYVGQFWVEHPQCGCSSVKMCEQRTWTVVVSFWAPNR